MAVRNALRLYVSGACKTKKEASAAVGLHPNYLTMLTSQANGSEPVKHLMGEMEEALQDTTLDMTQLVTYLGRKALMQVARLSELSQNERIILDASKELMDRSSELQRTQRLEVNSFTLDGKDVESLVAALTESSTVAREHAYAAAGLNEVVIDNFDQGPPAATTMQPVPKALRENEPGQGLAAEDPK